MWNVLNNHMLIRLPVVPLAQIHVEVVHQELNVKNASINISYIKTKKLPNQYAYLNVQRGLIKFLNRAFNAQINVNNVMRLHA